MLSVAARCAERRRPSASATPIGAALSIPRKWKGPDPAKGRKGSKPASRDLHDQIAGGNA
jgi:hypothetical protein